MRGFHRDRDRQHSGRREHDERQGRPTQQMRGREMETSKKKNEVGEIKEKDSGQREMDACGNRVEGETESKGWRVSGRGRDYR